MTDTSILRHISVKTFIDSKGVLSVIELQDLLPFSIARVYYITNVKSDAIRGSHAHKTLSQLFLATSGSYSLRVHDGNTEELVRVSSHDAGYLVPSGVWRSLEDWTHDAACLVLASHPYDALDYIHDFEEFLRWKKY